MFTAHYDHECFETRLKTPFMRSQQSIGFDTGHLNQATSKLQGSSANRESPKQAWRDSEMEDLLEMINRSVINKPSFEEYHSPTSVKIPKADSEDHDSEVKEESGGDATDEEGVITNIDDVLDNSFNSLKSFSSPQNNGRALGVAGRVLDLDITLSPPTPGPGILGAGVKQSLSFPESIKCKVEF